MRSTYLYLRGTCTCEIAIIYHPLYLKQSVDGAIMDPLEGTSTETRMTTTSEEGAKETAQAVAFKGLLKELILEVLRENLTILSTSTGKDPKEVTGAGKISVILVVVSRFPTGHLHPTGLVVGVVQSHWAGSRCCSIPLGWESVLVNPTGLAVGGGSHGAERSQVPGVTLG